MKIVKIICSHSGIALSITVIVLQILDYYNPTMSFVSNKMFTGIVYGLSVISFINALIIIVEIAKSDIKKKTDNNY